MYSIESTSDMDKPSVELVEFNRIITLTNTCRIKAVAGVSAADMGRTFREGWTGGGPASSVIGTLEAVAKQRTTEANGAEPAYLA
ncbi:hypothetical protein [Paenibacillus harenae]|uniref:hypothetical protein n=1 Tax=Paenibacillus harenae TaxID=306543 RepID=UPI0027D8837D|nr:hypothetical protein [Paenibacillus harenae]